MKKLITRLSIWFKQRKLYQQCLLACIPFLLLFFIWDIALLAPSTRQQQQLKLQLQQLKQEIALLKNQTQSILQTHHNNQLRNKNAVASQIAIDQQLLLLHHKVLSAATLQRVLTRLLEPAAPLKLIKFNTLPAQLFTATLQQQKITLYRHTLILVLKGDFFGTLDYLKNLESFNSTIYWDSLDYSVKQYPIAIVTLKLHIVNNQAELLAHEIFTTAPTHRDTHHQSATL